MNIGIFADCYLPTKNGVATAIAQAKRELELRGHRAVVLTVAYPGDIPIGPGAAIWRFASLPFNSQIEARLGLIWQRTIDRIVTRERLDVIHTHTEFSLGWAGRRAAYRAGLPLIHTLHTFYPAYRHYLPLGRLLPEWTINRILARFLRRYDAVVCPSEKSRAYIISCAPAVLATVIGNGVSQERFSLDRITQEDRDRMRTGLGIRPGDRIVLYVGRLAQEKRVSALFAALQPLLRADAGCRALFVGTGPACADLATAVRAAGLERQVLLTGPIAWERMIEIYAISHVLVTASLSEIHPMTLIEATMCGLPIVARRDTSFSDLVLDGSTGFLVDSDREIADKVAVLLQDETTRRLFAANTQALSARFTVEAHVDRLERLYQQIIDNRLREVSQ